MKKIHRAIIISCLIAGCQKSSSDSSISMVLPPENDSTSSQVIFPNRVGDEWHYLVNDTTIQITGLDSPTATSSQYNVDVVVVGRIRLPNNAIATIWQYHYPGSLDSNYVYQSGDSIRFLDRRKNSTPKVYITPFEVGSNWLSLSGELDFKKVTSRGTVTIEDSTYINVWEIIGGTTLPDSGYLLDEHFEDHIGFVKSYFNNSGAFLDMFHHTEWSLVSYKLK